MGLKVISRSKDGMKLIVYGGINRDGGLTPSDVPEAADGLVGRTRVQALEQTAHGPGGRGNKVVVGGRGG